MKIYEVVSWPAVSDVPQVPRRYFFTSSKAADKFATYLNKVEPGYPHYGVEFEVYDYTNNWNERVILANKDNNGLVVEPNGLSWNLPHDCTYCNERHNLCEYSKARIDDKAEKWKEIGTNKKHYFEIDREYNRQHPCEHFQIGKCMLCPKNNTSDPECESNQSAFDWQGCDRRQRALNHEAYKNNKGYFQEKWQRWSAENKEYDKARKREYYWKNRERILAYQREYRKTHREEYNGYSRSYYAKHRKKESHKEET